jgi:hypothetical protein
MVSDGIKIPFVIDCYNRTGGTDSNTVRAAANRARRTRCEVLDRSRA